MSILFPLFPRGFQELKGFKGDTYATKAHPGHTKIGIHTQPKRIQDTQFQYIFGLQEGLGTLGSCCSEIRKVSGGQKDYIMMTDEASDHNR